MLVWGGFSNVLASGRLNWGFLTSNSDSNPMNWLINIKNKKQIKTSNFIRSCFLILGLWALKSSIFDSKLGFYVKNPPRNRLESSQIQHPGQHMFFYVLLFKLVYFSITSWGYKALQGVYKAFTRLSKALQGLHKDCNVF